MMFMVAFAATIWHVNSQTTTEPPSHKSYPNVKGPRPDPVDIPPPSLPPPPPSP